ncbi:MAG: hypothetical protein JKY56_09545 [Kofleriaceae bacterium]|nr:hypothetical protein [Kofleriaceae bacterium]
MTGLDEVGTAALHGDASSMTLWYVVLGIFLTVVGALVLLYRLATQKADEEAIDKFLEEHEVFR